MKALRVLWLPALLALIVLAGCQQSPDTAKDKIYDLKAKVVAVDASKNTVTLDHEDIPGYMNAMKMSFAVENPKLLEGLKPDDQVEGKLRVRSGERVIVELKKR